MGTQEIKTIKLGICIPSCSMGGVNRGHITLMNNKSRIEWTGVAIKHSALFDIETAKLILKHCPIYSTKDNPVYKGLVTIVNNACQTVIDKSDVVKFWGYLKDTEETERAKWDKPILIMAHGECNWTRKNIEFSMTKGTKHLFIAVSNNGVNCFPENIRSKVKVIHNGVNIERCLKTKSRYQLRERLGIMPHNNLIGHVGRFGEDKNPFALAKAVKKLGSNYYGLYCGTSFEKQNFIERLKEVCENRIIVLPRTEQIGNILASLDCLLLASPSEACPNIVLESWIARCPVISTRVGFIPDLENKHGQLTFRLENNFTNKELCNVIKSTLENKNKHAITDKSFNVAREHFDEKIMIGNYCQFINSKL